MFRSFRLARTGALAWLKAETYLLDVHHDEAIHFGILLLCATGQNRVSSMLLGTKGVVG